jgi:hypothetical protein
MRFMGSGPPVLKRPLQQHLQRTTESDFAAQRSHSQQQREGLNADHYAHELAPG